MELVDPQLKGNFPEEEVQVMAYLAKECLLLDPDTRPTMSEVVQILLSISPGKSRRRRNITGSLFQVNPCNLSSFRFLIFQSFDVYFGYLVVTFSGIIDHSEVACKMKNKPYPDMFFLDGLVKEPQDEEKQRQATPSKFPTHSSLPIYLDHNHSVKNKTKEADPVSAEYMESLIILASKSDGSCVSEEEMVDLTEPRFESFCITSGKAP